MSTPLHELKARLKVKIEQDGRFSDGYCKIIMEYVSEIIKDITQREKK